MIMKLDVGGSIMLLEGRADPIGNHMCVLFGVTWQQ